jgi:hypothetical protein
MRYLLFVCVIVCLSVISIWAQVEESPSEIESKLLLAASSGDVEGIRLALSEGEEINVANVNGWTAASFAVTGANMEVLSLLIEEGIDLNIANNDGFTPLMLAALQVSHFFYNLFFFVHNIFIKKYRATKRWWSNCWPRMLIQALPPLKA